MNDTRVTDVMCGFVLGFLCMAVIVAAFGPSIRDMRAQAIKAGVAQYNPKTGGFEWKANLENSVDQRSGSENNPTDPSSR